MSRPFNFTTTFIPGTACIGDSRVFINNNFSSLLSAVSTVWVGAPLLSSNGSTVLTYPLVADTISAKTATLGTNYYSYTTNMSAGLQFSQAFGLSGQTNKINFWNNTDPYGFGIASNELSYIAENHVFYVPADTAPSAAMIVTNTGNVGIGLNQFSTQSKPTERLTVIGNVSSTQTVYASSLQLNNATLLSGVALSTSLSCLLITINGQRVKIPLLAI